MENIIETKNLTKIYKNLRAVDNLNMTVRSGEIFGLLGQNGAGKTTTIKMLTTIIKPTSGTAIVDGHDIVKESMKVRDSIGIVPQELTTDEDLSGYENLMLIADFYNIKKSDARAKALELLKMVDLEDAARRPVSTYSGGMRKRIELIAGLVHSPKVLFLDEPTLGLDVQTRTNLWSYIKAIKENLGITIILTSHYLEEVDALADHIAIIDHGRLLKVGTSEELKEGLGGDIISMELNSESEVNLLKDFPAKETSINGSSIRFKVENSDAILPELMNILYRNHIWPRKMTVEKPSLDEAFLEYTGRKINDETPMDYVKTMNYMRRISR
ncbi:ATP-binding cassette domain-containing protein [Picrophilus oshimae]|uniref:ABC-2 type transport system ATP-binding protein n=1 Tax=Picrophilus torridus (strain ATCC 700027 / DSM 9790 / JCM 10055 / NBRC 100828 / KAW 2/3) TaxID=1122961 RepID=A0A8G2L8C9_PICTO|nr:ATP-binding cassette domain-containing protein [Picrophilus oshimae]SMD31305.1 ABC-2 type transport system ATP-binding protein [Picrophilus oshimae DSM 9789]